MLATTGKAVLPNLPICSTARDSTPERSRQRGPQRHRFAIFAVLTRLKGHPLQDCIHPQPTCRQARKSCFRLLVCVYRSARASHQTKESASLSMEECSARNTASASASTGACLRAERGNRSGWVSTRILIWQPDEVGAFFDRDSVMPAVSQQHSRRWGVHLVKQESHPGSGRSLPSQSASSRSAASSLAASSASISLANSS